ncbi:MAG TPA: GNAT family N-acetyltransferase [Cellulomonas sp.]|nr:GNAT family N-acetyltransferase [Cellulomonas sp.]
MAPRRATTLDEQTGGRVLDDADIADALAVCAQDPVGAVLATARLEQALTTGIRRAGGELWGYQRDGRLEGICWAGANMVPVVPEVPGVDPDRAIESFASMARRQGRRCSSLVGPAYAVLGLWGRLRPAWPGVREVRDDQPSMVIDSPPVIDADPRVRRSRLDELPAVLPACVRMFTEEVGYSPSSGPGGPYETRVRGLVTQGRSYVRMSDDEHPKVMFKAELGAVAGGVAQVQGVWVAPEHRGRGLSERGMAAVVEMALADVAPVVSLYVNAYNARALAAYRRVGFRQVGSYATVLF